MNRPEVRNAFNDAMVAELTGAFGALEAERDVRAVVLAGRGPAFCAGADLNWMKKMAGFSFAHNYEDALCLAQMLHSIDTLSKPTVARVHGAAFAGGMGLVAACDIAVAAQDAEFCVSEAKLGLIPAIISPYVIAAMGERAARRYFLSAERFAAAEAYRIGLVQELALAEELDAVINAVLGHLVQCGPAALAATKGLIRSVARTPIDEALIADTAKRIATVRASSEGKEGVRAFLEKRTAAWVPLPDETGGSGRAAKRTARARKA
ncbi:MAG: enoyl-CoA hydratase/isomerase family protein [Betaproteobacteria bacterium]|nr:enoyl-CoA hydratase/isomerase family protein [Betaproteobacteria bacterium]